VSTLEHALSAVCARGCFEGVTLEVWGPEVPLLDGSAGAWAQALEALGATPGGGVWEVRRAARFTVGESALTLSPGGSGVRAWTDLQAQGLGAREVAWAGDWASYRARLAPARTFGFAHEEAALRAAGLARGLSPEAVVVYDGGRPRPDFAQPTDADEPFRHKLLDVLGDLGLLGGSVHGGLLFERPGHARTLALLRLATGAGALAQ
jgi:UDP-3-O-[3-hydroxymyristoyl] N-acetylglucosamine deacetylase